MCQAICYQARRHALQIELQAARQHSGGYFFRVCRSQQKFDVLGRLFECLQQRIERILRQHVHLVNEVHLVAAACGRVLHVIEQVASIVDFGPGCCVDFNQIDEPAFIDLTTGTAFAAGFSGDSCLTVQCFGQNACDRRLADSASSCKQIGVMQSTGIECIHQCLEHVLLTHRLREVFGPPLTGKDKIAHGQ